MNVKTKFNKSSYLRFGLLFAGVLQRSKDRMFNSLKKRETVAHNFMERSQVKGALPTLNLPEGDYLA